MVRGGILLFLHLHFIIPGWRLTDFSTLLLGLGGDLALAGATLTGTTMAFILIMIVAVIFIALTTHGSMEGGSGSMILGTGTELPIGIKPPVTDLGLQIGIEPPVIVLAFKGCTRGQMEGEVTTIEVIPMDGEAAPRVAKEAASKGSNFLISNKVTTYRRLIR